MQAGIIGFAEAVSRGVDREETVLSEQAQVLVDAGFDTGAKLRSERRVAGIGVGIEVVDSGFHRIVGIRVPYRHERGSRPDTEIGREPLGTGG